MTSKQQKRRCIIGAVLLFALLPGFPLWFTGGALLIGFTGLQELAMGFVLYPHYYYYSFARIFLGDSLIPLGMMGPNPTTAGYVVAAIFYALIASVLSRLLYRWLRGHVSSDPNNGLSTPPA